MACRLQAMWVMQINSVNPIEVPEDVRADIDVEERRKRVTSLPATEAVPDDTRSELDREARLADAELQMQLSQGQQPAAQDEPDD